MNKILLSGAAAAAFLATSAQADILLEVDLMTANQITITATSGVASTSATTTDFTGFLLAGFYGSSAGVSPSTAGQPGTFTTANNPSDGLPSLFRATGNLGLNIWDFSSATNVSVTAGSQAFTGSATWTVTADAYAAMLSNAGGVGEIYFGADDDSDISTATNIGQYRVVPAPASMAVLGLGGFAAARRRRA